LGPFCCREGLKEVFQSVVEELVEGRTAELTAANEQLQQEIIEHKEAEEKIKKQTEFLNSVIESLPHPFCVIDAFDYTIKLANSAAHAGDLTEGVTCHSLTHKSDKPCSSKEHPCPLDIIKETKRPVTVEHVHFDKDGNPRNVEVHAYPVFDSEGNVSQMIESSLDVTDRKQAEQERVQREKLEGILEMAGAVCHEFNQPLQGILGFSELLMRQIGEDNPIYRYAKSIQGEVNRMADLTRKLLDIEDRYATKPYLDGRIIDIDEASKEE
jgi:PAS domain S-box-containing protein